jgi:uncharacterized protein
MTSQNVRHNEEDRQFELPVEGGLAFVSYSREDERITFHHTEVPEQSEGKGVAAKVVAAALDYACDNGLRVVPECAYVAGYVKRHGDKHPRLALEAD